MNGSNNDDSLAGEAGAGSFGNGDVEPPVALPPLPDAGACPPGMRCHDPNTVDEAECGVQTLEAEVEVIEHPGNVLLVFDTSGSMAMEWNGQQRWEAAGNAIEAALSPLTDMLTIGAVFFPRSDPNAMPVCIDPTGITCLIVPGLMVAPGTCGVTPISAADQLNFTAGADFMSAFVGPMGGAPPYAPVPQGFTPLKEGLQQAQMALASTTLTGITTVIVITDGDPNCEWDAAVSRQIVTEWHAAGINTHVIGLPGLSGMGEQVLNELAAAGGTGQYIPPTDAAALETKLREIAMETVQAGFETCTINLVPPAEAPDKLQLVLTEQGEKKEAPRQFMDQSGGWALSDDAAVVTLEGSLCDDALAGRFQALEFQFGCVDLPPLPPIPPPE